MFSCQNRCTPFLHCRFVHLISYSDVCIFINNLNTASDLSRVICLGDSLAWCVCAAVCKTICLQESLNSAIVTHCVTLCTYLSSRVNANNQVCILHSMAENVLSEYVTVHNLIIKKHRYLFFRMSTLYLNI